jgi:membrane protein
LELWIGGLATFVTAFDFFLLELATTTLLFAVLYRYLPEARPGWRDVWLGALLAAAVLAAGEDLIGLSIGRSTAADLYGAAGSVLVLMLWVYYASAIFLFGGCVTAARAALPAAEGEAQGRTQ